MFTLLNIAIFVITALISLSSIIETKKNPTELSMLYLKQNYFSFIIFTIGSISLILVQIAKKFDLDFLINTFMLLYVLFVAAAVFNVFYIIYLLIKSRKL